MRRLLLIVFVLAVACGSERTAPASPTPEPLNLGPMAWSTIPSVTRYTRDTARMAAICSSYTTSPSAYASSLPGAGSTTTSRPQLPPESAGYPGLMRDHGPRVSNGLPVHQSWDPVHLTAVSP